MTNFQTALETMTVKDVDNREVLWHGPVRFERSAGKSDRNAIDLPKFLHELCSTLSAFDPHFLFRDKSGQDLSMDALPSSQANCEDLFNYQVIEKRNSRQMLFVADIISSKSIGQLKNAAWSLLKKFGIWMFRHELSVKRLDVGTSGWILGANPRYHSPDLQRNFITQELDRWWTSLTPTVQTTWAKKLKRHCHTQSKFPEFYCNPRNIKGEFSSIVSTTSAFHIVSATDDTRILDEVLKAAFPPESTQADNGIGIYIPMGLRRSNAGNFLRLVQRQQEYIDSYQVVSVAGLTKTIMSSPMKFTTASGETRILTVQEAFLLDPSINRIDPGSYLIRLGKWNVSTTKDDADNARNWVDTVLDAMPDQLRHNKAYEPFPTATRMKASPKPAESGYANIAGTYSVNSLKAHQDARQKPSNGSTNRNQHYSTNPQEPGTSPMATFTPVPNSTNLSQSSYARAASYYLGNPISDLTSTGYGDPMGLSTISKDILSIKQTLATLQKTPPPPKPTNDNPETSASTPDLMQMFQQIHQSMQESKSQLSQFQQSMESKHQTMDSSIRAVQKEQRHSKSTAAKFQDEMQAEIRTLRSENNHLHSRIDNIANDNAHTPTTSPRRKKLKETPETKAKTKTDNQLEEMTEINLQSQDTTVPNPNDDDTGLDEDSDASSSIEEDAEMLETLIAHRVTTDQDDDTNMGSDIPDQEPAFPARHH
jgi:hypothetical protein